MTKGQNLSRSSFLRISTRLLFWLAGALGLGGLVRFFSYEPDEGYLTTFDIGSAEDFAIEGKFVYPDIPAVVYYSGGNFQAYSLMCTHLGCTLEELEDTFNCPCHGSSYSLSGEVLSGPAVRDLLELHVEVSQEGRVILNTGVLDQ